MDIDGTICLVTILQRKQAFVFNLILSSLSRTLAYATDRFQQQTEDVLCIKWSCVIAISQRSHLSC